MSDNGKTEVHKEKPVPASLGPSKNSTCSELEMKLELRDKRASNEQPVS
jgi:hypothetical protein